MVHEKITSYEEAILLSEIAANAGAIMLANGAEIYRVEDTVERIIRSKKSIKDVDVYATVNVIIISFSYEGNIHTNLRRVKTRGTNLHYVDKVNTFSRNFSQGMYTLDEAVKELENIRNSKGTSTSLKILGASIASGAYSILIGASIKEIVPAFIVGLLGYLFCIFLEKNSLTYFIVHFLYGIFVSFLALLISYFTGSNYDIIIISAMMAFVPGMPITNAVRDIMSGDATSGLIAATLAFLISIALALGVAIPISLFRFVGLI